VVYLNDDASIAVGVKRVTDQEFWVPLHVPGRPLMPGVLMIEAAAQLSSVQYHRKTVNPEFVGFTRCEKAAFRGQVVPGESLYLVSREIDFRRRRFITETQGMIDSKIVFEARITGMVL